MKMKNISFEGNEDDLSLIEHVISELNKEMDTQEVNNMTI